MMSWRGSLEDSLFFWGGSWSIPYPSCFRLELSSVLKLIPKNGCFSGPPCLDVSMPCHPLWVSWSLPTYCVWDHAALAFDHWPATRTSRSSGDVGCEMVDVNGLLYTLLMKNKGGYLFGFVWKCCVYSQWNSHLIVIMISKTIGV